MYLGYQNGKIKFYTEEILNPSFYPIERSEFTNEEYVYDADLEEYVINNKEFQARQLQKEKERIAKLKLTKREVFLGLYQAKGVTPDMIKAQITDPQALIEFEYANDYYRGNPLIDIVGATLGITPEQLDKFFEINDYTVLMPPIEPEQPIEEDNENTENATL
jgi:hypothetical protein